jgi:ABC-type ATPase involved in cell division
MSDYFEDIEVRQGEISLPLSYSIPDVLGQNVLEGESGLGKSTFLRLLVNRSKRTNVYLLAETATTGSSS